MPLPGYIRVPECHLREPPECFHESIENGSKNQHFRAKFARQSLKIFLFAHCTPVNAPKSHNNNRLSAYSHTVTVPVRQYADTRKCLEPRNGGASDSFRLSGYSLVAAL